MPLTNFPNGITSFGAPVTGYLPTMPGPNGSVWFVDSDNGSDGANGQDAQNALATIQRAVNVARAGDIVLILPGTYAENIVITGKNYLTLIGAQIPGYARPDIAPVSGMALNIVTSQGIVLAHLRFASPAADTDLVRNEGNGFLFTDCVFDGDAAQGNAKALLRFQCGVTDTHFTASEGIVDGCLFRGSGGVGIAFDTSASGTVNVGSTDNAIRNCKFINNDQADIVTQDTSGVGTYSIQRAAIGPGNIFATKNATTYIDLTTTNGGAASDQNGTIVYNFFACDAIVAGGQVKMVGTGFTFVGNYNTVGVKDGSGLD